MAKKKRLYEGMDDDEIELLNSKMYPQHLESVVTIPTMKASYKVRLKCRNQKQKELHNLIKDKEIVFCQGSAGTGKSYVTAETALELLKNGSYKKIILCCPNVESSSMPLGYLPGNVDEKMQPFLDALEFTLEKVLAESGNMSPKKILEDMMKVGMIDEEPVSFLRGKTFDDSIIIIDEAENLNKQETLLILTRIGRNSKLIVLGDNRQMDRKDMKKSKEKCGLDHAFDVLKELDEAGFVQFTDDDIVRNPVITKIIRMWNDEPTA
jgi:phosphate starvation-inducible PhoH-like protein